MAEIHGRFLWFENLTRDVQAALGFYAPVIGWATLADQVDGKPYHMLTTGGMPLAGVHPIPEGAPQPPAWLGYVGTTDVAATTTLAESLGATVFVREMVIPGVGTISVLQDPQGAMFAVYRPAQLPDFEWPPEAPVGSFCWHELATTDVDAALAFYGRLFGWQRQQAHDMGHMGMYVEYGLPGQPAIGGMYTKPANMPGPPAWLYYARVADIEAALEAATQRGSTVLLPPVTVAGGGRAAVFADPQGAAFGIYEKK